MNKHCIQHTHTHTHTHTPDDSPAVPEHCSPSSDLMITLFIDTEICVIEATGVFAELLRERREREREGERERGRGGE